MGTEAEAAVEDARVARRRADRRRRRRRWCSPRARPRATTSRSRAPPASRCMPAMSGGASSRWRPSTSACWNRWPIWRRRGSSRCSCRCVPTGCWTPTCCAQALQVPTLLVSVMAVNNEIGVIQDISALAAIAKQAGALFHTDIAQAAGKIPLDLDRLEGRSRLDQRPQDLRAEGGRRAVRPAPAARAADAAVFRRRAGARAALRHAAGAADRRSGRGVPAGAGGNGGRGASGSPGCATGCWTGCARRSRASW